MKNALAIILAMIASIAVGIMILSLNNINDLSKIKSLLFLKQNLNIETSLAEEMTIKSISEKLENIEEIIVYASKQDDPSDQVVLYEKAIASKDYEKATEISSKEEKDLEGTATPQEILTYKVAELLRPENEMGKDIKAYNEINDKSNSGFRANLWNIAETMIGYSGIFEDSTIRPDNTNSYQVGSKTKDYHQEYPLDDWLAKKNIIELSGRISISGDLDKSINSYVSSLVEIKDGEINLFNFSLLEDKFEKIKEISISSPTWTDATPSVTSVYNENTQLLETFIAVYSPSLKKMNLYTYSLLDDKIDLVLEDMNLDSKIATQNTKDAIDSLIPIDEEVLSSKIKDVKITGEFNRSINLPQLVIGVNASFIYKEGNSLERDNILYNFDYIPIVDDFPTVSPLFYRGALNTWDFELVWSNATNTPTLAVLVQGGKELKFLSAMAIIDESYEHLPNMENFNEINLDINTDKISVDMIDSLTYTAYGDKSSNLTKTVIALKVGGKVYQVNGYLELEEWEDIKQIDKDVLGEIEIASSKGDISSIHLVTKPIFKNYFTIPLDIEIISNNQRDDINTIIRGTYDFKIFQDNKVEVETIERKRDFRLKNKLDGFNIKKEVSPS